MRAKYCCDFQVYQNYYLNQVGHDLPYFSGARYQKGYSLENIFSSTAKTVLPLVKSGSKTIGKQVLHSGVGFVSNVLTLFEPGNAGGRFDPQQIETVVT